MSFVQATIQSIQRSIENAKSVMEPEEFQAVLQWLADFVAANRSEEPA